MVKTFLPGGKSYRLIAQDVGPAAGGARKHEPAAHFARIARLRRGGVGDHHAQVERLAAADVGGNGHALDDDFGPGLIADRQHIDAHARLRKALGLLDRVAQVLVAVADDHDSLGGVLGKRGLGEFHRRGQVGVFGIEHAFDLRGQLHVVVERRDFDGGVAAEDDHAHAIAVLAMLPDLGVDVFDHRLAALDGNAERLIQQINHRQPVAGSDDLNFGQGEDQTQEHEAADNQDHHPPHTSQAGQLAIAVPPNHRYQRQKQQIPGR